MNQDKDDVLALRVENDPPIKVEVRRVIPVQSSNHHFNAAQYRQAMQQQQAAAYAAQQQAPPLTGLGRQYQAGAAGTWPFGYTPFTPGVIK